MKKINVKFCGGCNPDYDQKQLVNNLKEKFDVDYIDDFKKENVYKNILLLVNGCERRCLVKANYEDNYDLVIDVADFLDIFNKNNNAQNLSKKVSKCITSSNV